MECVIQNIDTKKFVGKVGGKHSYTPMWQLARVFKDEALAKKDACGNERVIPLRDLIANMPGR